MELPSAQELEGLKYSELQKLAKQAGLKANLKADRLLKALKKHFYPTALPEQTSDDSDGNCTLSDRDESQSCEIKEEQIIARHVTHRRGHHIAKIQKESISTVLDLKDDESNKVQQVPECEQIQEKNKKDEVSGKRGSARTQRKRRRTEDVISEKKNVCQGNPSPAAKMSRQAARLSKPGSKSSTPNFKKLHEAHFKKMESIDKYMERKQKRLDAVSSSIQEVKMMAMKSNLLTQPEKTPVGSSEKLLQSKFFILSPAPLKELGSPSQTPASQRRSPRFNTAGRSILANKSALKSFALSGSKMNVRFSEATKDNEHKRSLIKTPARKSSSFGTPESGAKKKFILHKMQPVLDANKSLQQCITDLESEESKILHNWCDENTMNQSASTPFKFTACSAETPNTNKKLKFDLQASLARPLGYQPHKGKLKPWGEGKENPACTRTTAMEMKNSFKQPILSTRDDRRKQHQESRKLRRDKAVGTRRGVND